MPKSAEEYRKALSKHAFVHPTVWAYANGKLLKEFNYLYDSLHVCGYYRGAIYNVDAVKDYLKAARVFSKR